jgi:hypothetical protein
MSFTGMDGPVPAAAGDAMTAATQSAAMAAHEIPQVRNLRFSAKTLPTDRRITESARFPQIRRSVTNYKGQFSTNLGASL